MAHWISINELKRLVKQGFYKLETGAHSGDQLIYERKSGSYVGHIENGHYYQDPNYQVPQHIEIHKFETFDEDDWRKDGIGW
jgi:hypothetical protein